MSKVLSTAVPPTAVYRCCSALLLFTVLSAVAFPAGAESWIGKYDSSVQRIKMTVRFTLPSAAAPGQLRFEPAACSLSLRLTQGVPSDAASYVIGTAATMPGPYCGGLLGGEVKTKRAFDAKSLEMWITRGTTFKVTLYPAPATK